MKINSIDVKVFDFCLLPNFSAEGLLNCLVVDNVASASQKTINFLYTYKFDTNYQILNYKL